MNESLQVFENVQFGTIRVIERDGEPWFVAVDVCRALEIANNRDALSRLDSDEKGVALTDTPGGEQKMAVVNEPGLYSLVLGSRKPEAKAFKRWITHEVIPAIRKTGMYSAKPMSPAEMLVAQAQALLDYERRLETQERQAEAISTRVDQIESYVKNHPEDHVSIIGYIKIKGLKNVGLEEAKALGREASRLSKALGYDVKKVNDSRFGKVNTYHIEVLEQVFSDQS